MPLTRVAGRCPSCHRESLYIAAGAHITCAQHDCTNPTAAHDLLNPDAPSPCGYEWLDAGNTIHCNRPAAHNGKHEHTTTAPPWHDIPQHNPDNWRAPCVRTTPPHPGQHHDTNGDPW